jgi:hypothetical protein
MPEPDQRTPLQDGLLAMADLPTAPADPLPAIQGRIVRRRRVRLAGAAVTLAACATLVAAVVPAIAGGGQTITPAGQTAQSHDDERAEPYSDREFTTTSIAHRPLYFVAGGTEAGEEWNALSTPVERMGGCLVVAPQTLNDSFVCFGDWTNPTKRADWFASGLHLGEKPNYAQLDRTLVHGAASIAARSVRIETADGKTYTTDAVATPTSKKLRFFAFVVPQRDAEITAVTPYDENGEVADPPRDMPPPLTCPEDDGANGPGWSYVCPETFEPNDPRLRR